ncbi:sensor histidine kinase [Ekhidna sp. To15]|uniref:sensor histidine kinase n=1 Tax=Ekhidna sp. To15 TaxID=3395267 RepID=UPI003F51D824
MKLKEVYIRWIGILVVAAIATINDEKSGHMSEEPLWLHFVVSLSFTIVYWNGATFVIYRFRKLFPEISKTARRLSLTAPIVVIWMILGGIPVKLLFGLCDIREAFTFSEHAEFLPFNMVAATVISLGYEAFYFFDKWKEQFTLNQQLKNQQIRTQYEVLQNQMSPHFLFNSLNTLTTIIPENADAAVSFTEKLSEVYRYILQNKDRELVSLKEEIEFVKSYLFLLRMRYPDNLSVEFSIDDKYLDLTIPPLTLQMLAENAIKHNVVSKAKPLHIDIYIENGKSVIVKNNLQRKNSLEKSTKTGLDNIRKRYNILGQKEIDIITSASNFMVAVPLIDLLEEKDLRFT